MKGLRVREVREFCDVYLCKFAIEEGQGGGMAKGRTYKES